MRSWFKRGSLGLLRAVEESPRGRVVGTGLLPWRCRSHKYKGTQLPLLTCTCTSRLSFLSVYSALNGSLLFQSKPFCVKAPFYYLLLDLKAI